LSLSFTLPVLLSLMARVRSTAREVVEATRAEILVKIVPREEHVNSSSVNCSSDAERESNVGSQGDGDPATDAGEASHN
jgi:hypothetical protein